LIAYGTPAAESYRALRTAIRHLSEEKIVRILAVVSPEAQDGKTTTAFNLAMSFAEAGIDVVCVEADMRRPSLARTMGFRESPGLAEFLAKKNAVSRTIQETTMPNLRVVTAGKVREEAPHLLGTDQVREFLQVASAKGLVIVDTPPVLAVSDAVEIASVVDGILLVIRAGKTKRERLRETVRALGSVGAPIMGVIVNDVTKAESSGYGYQYYAYPSRAQSTQSDQPDGAGSVDQVELEQRSSAKSNEGLPRASS
jgi:succinoglycan biosynthesis transport protein ExoP